jgi:Tol biopolymer transport system component
VAAIGLLIRGRGGPPALAEMSVVQNTFTLETIFNARWAPDGKTIVYSAIRQGKGPRLYVVRNDYPEPQPLGPDSVHLLSVSSTGELAILTHSRYLNHRLFTGTLSRMPLGGGAPREMMEGVREADWSPDGSQLAVVRAGGEGDQLEYPVGRVLHRSVAGGFLSDPRVSPTGDRIAFFDHPIQFDDRGSVVVVDSSGKATTVAADLWGLEGLDWAADGRTVLFSGADRGGMYQVHRAGTGLPARLVLPSPGTLTLQDVSRNGDWLVTRDDQPLRLFVRPPDSNGVRDLSWLENSLSPSLSGDGRLLAFTDQSIQAGPQYAVMMRKTDGSPVVRLGDGGARAISPDQRWVLGVLPTSPPQYVLYPTGAGQAHRLSWPRLETVNTVHFFPDGASLFVCGNERGRASRCYRSPLDGDSLQPLGPDSISAGTLRPDGRAMLVRRADVRWVYPLEGGAPRRVPGQADGEFLRWSPDGRALWVWNRAAQELQVDRVEVATGARSPLVSLSMPPGVPVFAIIAVTLADDPRVYAYSLWGYNSQLFTVQGVR